jgi:hypothetical protein
MLIKDSAQRRRALAPTEFGMNPELAERLTGRGIDPRDHNARIRGLHASAIVTRPETPGERLARVREQFGGQARRFAEYALAPNDVRVRKRSAILFYVLAICHQFDNGDHSSFFQ